jgi:hypothetical protein
LAFADLAPGTGVSSWEDIKKLSEADRNNFAMNILVEITDGHIPAPYSHDEFGRDVNWSLESEGPLRRLEEILRLDDWRKLTVDMFNENWIFVVETTNPVRASLDGVRATFKTLIGFIKKSDPDPGTLIAQQLVEGRRQAYDAGGAERATMTRADQTRWSWMALKFLWLDLFSKSTHKKAAEGNLTYQIPYLFDAAIERGEYKQLIDVKGVEKLAAQSAQQKLRGLDLLLERQQLRIDIEEGNFDKPMAGPTCGDLAKARVGWIL